MRKTNIILKNKYGEDVTYTDISTISFDGEDGLKALFIRKPYRRNYRIKLWRRESDGYCSR